MKEKGQNKIEHILQDKRGEIEIKQHRESWGKIKSLQEYANLLI